MTRNIDLASFPESFLSLSETRMDATYLERLDRELATLWSLGKNLILAWTPGQRTLDVLVVPHYLLSEHDAQSKNGGAHSIIAEVISGPNQVSAKELKNLCAVLDCRSQRIRLPFQPGRDISFSMIETLIKRYSVSYVEDRAVALFDIDDFSLLPALGQVTQLNSLAYSLNSAHARMLESGVEINFARSPTGDGFYIWNRDTSIQANVNLYNFMHFVLADNAIAQGNSRPHTTPHLRACFHVGGCYEFYQPEGLTPTIYSYIVGDVTINLARMIDGALPGQILVGEFMVPMPDGDQGAVRKVDALRFVEKAQETLSRFQGLVLSGDSISNIKCYLTGEKSTGEKSTGDTFRVARYKLADKHNLVHNVYNAKVNIYRKESPPIFLGLQTTDLSDFDYDDMTSVNPVDT